MYYGGNLSAMTWKATEPTTAVRGYSFTYDALSQLSSAVYGEGTAINTNPLRYDESFTYDKHGNIKTLKRYGLKDNNTFGIIDNLDIIYTENSIRSVYDSVTVNQSSSDVMEFKFNSEPVNDRHYYYSSGALANDYHKGICMIKYNYLTLPKSVQFRKGDRIEYVYDAAGVKRQTTYKVANRDMNYGYWSMDEPTASDFNSSLTVTTDYGGNKVYVNSQLKYVLTEEGYIEKTTGSNTYTAYYYLNDHLGNRRIVMDAAGTVKQVNNFYPSGTSMAERRTDQGVQPYKFGGKELDRTNGLDFYDFEARAYDPVLMRFTRVDPLAVKHPEISPFAYCNNNPVRFVDPTGLIDYPVNTVTSEVWHNFKPDDDVILLNEVTITSTKGGGKIEAMATSEEWERMRQNYLILSQMTENQLATLNKGIDNHINNTLAATSAILTSTDTYSSFFHNHTTYTTTKGNIANIYRPNGLVNSDRAAQFARTSKFLQGVGVASSGVMAYQGATNIYNGNATGWDYADVGVGVTGVGVGTASLLGFTSSVVASGGWGVAAYGWFRLWFELGAQYGPSTWYGTNDNKWFE